MSEKSQNNKDRDPLRLMDDWKTWTKEELEHQMNPSRWVVNKTEKQALMEFGQICKKGTENAKQLLANELNVPYGEKPGENLDVYGTDLTADSPIFFYIHGGAWQEKGVKDISAHFAPQLYKIGVKTIVFGYILAPQASIEEMQKELEEALLVAMEKYPNAFFILGGHSAGAQLCASILTSDAVTRIPILREKIKGILFLSGVYDMRPLVNTPFNDPLHLTDESAKNLSALLSPVNPGWTKNGGGDSTNQNLVKNMVVVGGHDSPEFQRQSLAFSKYLQAKGLGSLGFSLLEKDDHFSIISNLALEDSEAGKLLIAFVQKCL